MKRIIVSAYRCDPYGVSEAYSGFMTALMLADANEVMLCTPAYNLPSIRSWISSNASSSVMQNLHVLGVPVPQTDGEPDSIRWGLKPGFFLFDTLLTSMLRQSQIVRGASLVWHRTPMSYRYRTSLHRLGIPMIVGPVGGGLRPPAELAEFFNKERTIYRLRRLDGPLLASKWWTKPLDRARFVLITCDYVRQILPQRLHHKLVTVPETGIEPPQIETPRMHVGTDVTILYVGRLLRYKAPTMAVDAFSRMLNHCQYRSARLVIVGDGPERAACETLAHRLGTQDYVHFAGRLPKDQAQAWYSRADIFLFPSLTEATGNVYLEAMRAGLPLVVCANGGGQDIPPDAAAVKVPVGPYELMVNRIARSLRELIHDPERRKRMGSAGLRAIVDQYSWPALSSRLSGILDAAIEEGPSR